MEKRAKTSPVWREESGGEKENDFVGIKQKVKKMDKHRKGK